MQTGNPFSPQFADIYHSADSAAGQARHVFLRGNDLPARWAGARVFTIVETGFGVGVNFLATWQAWRDDPQRCARLHFVSIERWPFARADLATLHARHPEWAALSSQLRAAWPPLVPGMHRLHFDDDQVTLTLVFDEAIEAARGLEPRRRRLLSGRVRAGPQSGDVVGAAVESAGAARRARRDGGDLQCGGRGARRPDRSRIRRRKARRLRAQARHARRALRAALAGAATERSRRRGRSATRSSSAPDCPAPRSPRASRCAAGASISSNAAARLPAPRPRCAPACSSRTFRATIICFRASPAPDSSMRCGHGPARSTRDATPPWQRCGVLQLADGAENEARVADTAVALAHPVDYALHATRADAIRARRPARSDRRLVVSDGGIRAPGGDRRGAARPRCTVGRRRTGAGAPPRPQCRKPAARGRSLGSARRRRRKRSPPRRWSFWPMRATPPGWSIWAAIRCDEYAASKAICGRRRLRRRASSSAATAMCCRRSMASPSRARLTISTATIGTRTP